MAPPRVLIVEDERPIGILLGHIVERLGVEIELAHNGAEALTAIQARRPDLVLLDLIMPIMSGEELLAALEREGLLPGLPVIVISTREEVQGYEYLPLLTKPFSAVEVKNLVREKLGL